MSEDRTTLAARVVALRRERGAAGLDGKPFDHTALADAETRLAALEDIEAERSHRLSEASVSADQLRVAGLRADVGASYQEFLQRGAEAEQAIGALVTALRGMKATGAQIIRAATAIKAGLAPSAFEALAIEERMSRFLSWQLAALTGGTSRFGLFEWPGSSTEPTDFAEMERRATAAAIEAIAHPKASEIEPPPVSVTTTIEEQEFHAL